MENIFFDLSQLKHLGEGALIGKTVRIREPEKVSIGKGTIIDDFTYISGDVEIGCYSHIAPNCTLSCGAGKLYIGNFVGISSGSCIYVSSTDYVRATLDLPSVPRDLKFGGEFADVSISDFVLLGSHSVVLPGSILPVGFATTAQTVVRPRQFEEWTLYGGFECKLIHRRDSRELSSMKDRLLELCD